MSTTQQTSAYIAAIEEERAAWQALENCPPSSTTACIESYKRWRDAVDNTVVEIRRMGGQAPRASDGAAPSKKRNAGDRNEPSQ